MSVYRRGGVYQYDFEYKGQRYRGTTNQRVEEDARLVESTLKLQLRQDLAGVGIADPKKTPRIQDFAEIYYDAVKEDEGIGHPERIAGLLRVVLRFFGAKPERDHGTVRIVDGEPYHDLHLGDLVANPFWLVRFERWMKTRVYLVPTKPGAPPKTRPLAVQTKNQYRSAMSQMFELACAPEYRLQTRITMNPFTSGRRRGTRNRRTAVVTVAELRAILLNASYHVRLALAIAGLAPKLRKANILGLRWDRHVDRELRYLTVAPAEHKVGARTGRPLVLPISGQLRAILLDARARAARHRVRAPFVVTYHGKGIKDLHAGVQNACARAGVRYGRFTEGGITFHSLRHIAGTMLAELGVAEGLRKETLGHEDLSTTQLYTHVRPIYLEAPVEQLADALPIQDMVTLPWRRASGKPRADVCTKAGETAGTAESNVVDFRSNPTTARTVAGEPKRT